MNVPNDILIPFLVGIFGIYITYMLFDLFLKMSFQIANSIKEELSKRETSIGKILTVIIALVILVGIGVLIITFLFNEDFITKKIVSKIFFCLFGFGVFVAFFNSPIHERFKK